MSGVKVGGVWKTPSTVYVKVNGVWKTASTVYTKVNGVWKITTLGGAPPPVMTYVSTGVFEVSNTVAGVYTATLVSGSGSATQSTVGGKVRFTLSSTTARFNITFAYAAGAPQSVAAPIERKPFDYSCRQVPYDCSYPCNCRTEGVTCYCIAGPCPGDCPPNGQCGCGGATPCQCGSLGYVVCDTCPKTCYNTVCDVLIDETVNGYTNGGSEWYKLT